MKWLEELLKDVEDKDNLVDEIKKKIGENFVPNTEYKKKTAKINELDSELKTAQSQLEDFDTKIEKLKTKANNADELQTELNNITEEYDNYKEQESERIKSIKTKNALEKQLLTDNVPKDLVDLVVNDFDTEQLELTEEGQLLNYESQRKKAKEKRPSAFAETTISGTKPSEGDEGKIVDNPFKAETRNLTKQGKLVKEKPETAKKLIKAAGGNPARYRL